MYRTLYYALKYIKIVQRHNTHVHYNDDNNDDVYRLQSVWTTSVVYNTIPERYTYFTIIYLLCRLYDSIYIYNLII